MRTIIWAFALTVSQICSVNAAIYHLTFDNNSSLESPEVIISEANFAPITLFNGDTLSIVFNNVPSPTYFPTWAPKTEAQTALIGVGVSGPVTINEEVFIGTDSLGVSTMDQSRFGPDFSGFHSRTDLFYAPDWTISLQVLSGSPSTSSGLTVDQFEIAVATIPEPSTWAMMLIGFAGITIASRRLLQPHRIVT